MIGLSNGSKQGDKSAQHSKLIRNVAGRIFPCGFAAHEIPCSFFACLAWWFRHQKSTRGTRLHQGVFAWTAWPHCGAFASFPKKMTNARQLPSGGNEHACNWLSRYSARLQVVPHFSSGIVERAKCECAWKSPHMRKGNTRRGERKMRDPHFFSLLVMCRLFLRGVIFTRANILLALLSLRKIRDYTRSLYSADQLSGAPNVNFRKISVGKTIWSLEFSEHLL